MVVSGEQNAVVEAYDPSTDTSTHLAAMPKPMQAMSCTGLADGRILVLGTVVGDPQPGYGDRFVPSSGALFDRFRPVRTGRRPPPEVDGVRSGRLSRLAKFHYGGQALIEGVLMRGQSALAVALRHPEGYIVWATERLDLGLRARRALKLPLVRGLVLLYDTLVTGTRWLVRSRPRSFLLSHALRWPGSSAPNRPTSRTTTPIPTRRSPNLALPPARTRGSAGATTLRSAACSS
jgi:hypothetical protein